MCVYLHNELVSEESNDLPKSHQIRCTDVSNYMYSIFMTVFSIPSNPSGSPFFKEK